MKKSNFEELIPEITRMAKNMTRLWDNKFETNELVNEAWIRRRKLNSIDIPLVLRRARFDMIDYIRKEVGRSDRPKYLTNIYNGKENENNFFDVKYIDKNLSGLENEELINFLLNDISDREETVIRKFFLDGKRLKEIGNEIERLDCPNKSFRKEKGVDFSRISSIKRSGLLKCKEKLREMEIEVL